MEQVGVTSVAEEAEEALEEEYDDSNKMTTSSSDAGELKIKRAPKRPLNTYYTVTANTLDKRGKMKRSSSLTNVSTLSENESSITTSTSTTKHFYQKNGDTVIYFSDENLIGAVENAATTLTTALQNHSHQVIHALSPKQQRERDILAIQDQESHQRRFMAQQTLEKRYTQETIDPELWQGQERLAKSLKVKKIVHTRLNHLINAALKQSQMLLNLKAFVIFREGGIYQPFNAVATGGVMYESMQNDFEHRVISLPELLTDLMQLRKGLQEEVFKELLHICFFLEDPRRPLSYIIYKRAIEYVGSKPLDDSTSVWARWFLPHQQGQYYAIIVNFAHSKRSVLVRPPESVKRAFSYDRTFEEEQQQQQQSQSV